MAWEKSMDPADPMYGFIMSGVQDGFHITDCSKITTNVEVDNYNSATARTNRSKVEAQIQYEIQNFRYVPVRYKPQIISALGAVPKSSDSVRLIHDCSRPCGHSLNDFNVHDPFQYQSLQDAVDHIKPGYYLAKLDLESAYRSVRIHPSNYAATGLKWTFSGDKEPTYLIDTRLPFGARASPGIFHQLGQAVRRMLARKRIYNVIVYLDDFLIIAETKELCNYYLRETIHLLRYLGFSINYNKVIGASQVMTFLGIELNTVNMTLSLPEDKLKTLKLSLMDLVSRKKVSKKALQSLAGKLNWACQCIYGGRIYMRRILDAIRTLTNPWHRTRITQALREDIWWWINYLSVFNGYTEMVESRPITPVCIDACPVAAGAVHSDQFVYTPWSWWPGSDPHHINFKETLALEPAVAFWGPSWRNKKVYVRCDNQAAVGIINKGTCRNEFVMQSLRRVFWYSVFYNFRLKAMYIPGKYNQMADAISRMHEYFTMPCIPSNLDTNNV